MLWGLVNHKYMHHICAKGFFDSNSNEAVIDKISVFHQIAPNFTYKIVIKYNWNFLDQFALSYKFHGRGIKVFTFSILWAVKFKVCFFTYGPFCRACQKKKIIKHELFVHCKNVVAPNCEILKLSKYHTTTLICTTYLSQHLWWKISCITQNLLPRKGSICLFITFCQQYWSVF